MQSRKCNPEQKKYKKRKNPQEEEVKVLEYSEEEEELEVVPLAKMSNTNKEERLIFSLLNTITNLS